MPSAVSCCRTPSGLLGGRVPSSVVSSTQAEQGLLVVSFGVLLAGDMKRPSVPERLHGAFAGLPLCGTLRLLLTAMVWYSDLLWCLLNSVLTFIRSTSQRETTILVTTFSFAPLPCRQTGNKMADRKWRRRFLLGSWRTDEMSQRSEVML